MFTPKILATQTSTGLPAKQITVSGTPANSVMYIVPAGRKFVGVLTQSNTDAYAPTINGMIYYNASTRANTAQSMVLAAGTVVKESASAGANNALFGVESDA